jgi:sec-independent protein translocase protein TatB
MAIIAGAALILLGPKELPNALRTMTMVMKNARKLANEFQSGVNDIIREADLEDARKKLQEVQSLNKNQIEKAIEKAIDPTGEVKESLKAATDIDPTGPARTDAAKVEATPAETPAIADASGADAAGEDAAVETAAAKPVPPPVYDHRSETKPAEETEKT